MLARKLLNRIDGTKSEETQRRGLWLKDEVKQVTNPFIASVVDLWEWAEPDSNRRNFSLQNYKFASAAEYEEILPIAWNISKRYEWKNRIQVIHHPSYREAFFSFCAGFLKFYDFADQKQFLGTLVRMSNPHGNENRLLITGVLSVERPDDLAQHYAAVLEQLPEYDSDAIRTLKSLAPEKSWFNLFGFWRR